MGQIGKRNDPLAIAQIILDRFRGVSQKETAQTIGLKSAEAVSRIASHIELDQLEMQIRMICSGNFVHASPEVLSLNAEHEARLKRINVLLDKEVEHLEKPPVDDKPCETCGLVPYQLKPQERMQTINGLLAASEKTREASLKIKGMEAQTKAKKNAEPEEIPSRYDTLLEDE